MKRFGCILLIIVAFVVWLLPFLGHLKMEKHDATVISCGYRWRTARAAGDRDCHDLCITTSPSGSIFGSWGDTVPSRSTDGGKSWHQTGKGIKDCVIGSIVADDKGILYFSSERGIYRSLDDGDTWKIANTGLPSDIVYSVIKDSEGHVYAAVPEGLYSPSSDRQQWTFFAKPSQQSNHPIMAVGRTSKGTLFLGTDRDGLFRSSDGGKKWACVDRKIVSTQENGIISRVTSIAVDSEDTIYALIQLFWPTESYDDEDFFIMRSDDEGRNWKKIRPARGLRLESLAVASNDDLVVGTRQGLFISRDRGEHFEVVTTSGQVMAILGLYPNVRKVATDRQGRIATLDRRGIVAVGTPVKH